LELPAVLLEKEEFMAARVTALRKYRPELKLMSTMQTPEMVEHIAQRTGLNEGEIRFVVCELRDTLLMATHRGQAVKIEGLGTFTPTLRLDGRCDLLFRTEPDLRKQLNNKTKLYGKILNKGNIGKSSAELVALWNQEHPEDPVRE
jgi:hypothetical protein